MSTESDIPLSPRKRFLKDLFLPLIVIIAGIIISFSIYVVRVRDQITNGSGNPEAVRPVSPEDHIIGNPSAPIVIVEYADIDSEHSKKLQLTLEQLMTEYAEGNKVAWVYRHFPITELHGDAAMNAHAAECAGSISAPMTFFRFIDAMHAIAPGSVAFNPKQHGTLLTQLSLPENSFNACMSARTFEERIHEDYTNALASGATGSPYIILLVEGQAPRTIQGAPPYKTMKGIIEAEIAKLPNGG